MPIHTIENVTPEILENGLNQLRDSGFTVEGNRVSGMGIEASFELIDNVLTVNVEKAPAFPGQYGREPTAGLLSLRHHHPCRNSRKRTVN